MDVEQNKKNIDEASLEVIKGIRDYLVKFDSNYLLTSLLIDPHMFEHFHGMAVAGIDALIREREQNEDNRVQPSL